MKQKAFLALGFSLLQMLPGMAQAAGDYTYVTNSGKITITKYTGSGGAVVVPDTLGGYPVTGLGDEAFYDTAVSSITIGSNVTFIGEYVFDSCSKLSVITVNALNPSFSSTNGVLFNKSKTELVVYPPARTNSTYTVPGSVESIWVDAFFACTNLTRVTIPDSVTFIGSYAFQNCYSLTNVVLPAGLTTIEDSVFDSCIDLVNVTIPDGVTSIGYLAFSSCESLTQITIPGSVSSLGLAAFSYCTSLTGAYFYGDAPYSSGYAFDGSSAVTVYYVAGTARWPAVPDLWDERPTALWQPILNPDADGDGLPDSWEQQYFGGATNANPAAVCSNKVNTVLEAYIAGLNPTNSQSVFRVSASSNGKQLGWNTVSGRVYSVHWSTNLMSGFSCLASNIPWTQVSFTNSTNAPRGFHKVEVRLE